MQKTFDKLMDWSYGSLVLNKLSDSDLSNILVALEKQIPIKPRVETTKEVPTTHNLGRLLQFFCPKCGKSLGAIYETDPQRILEQLLHGPMACKCILYQRRSRAEVDGDERGMSMLIRSQNKKRIANFNNCNLVTINPNCTYVNITIDGIVIGTYSTEEKAIKVLDMIQDEYAKHFYSQGGQMATANYYVPPFAFVPPKVFQMPQDSEV